MFTKDMQNNILNHVFRGETYTPPSKLYVGLLTSSGEVSAKEYERQEITFTESTTGENASDEEVRFPIATSDWGTVNGMGIFDAETDGTQLDELSVPDKSVTENEQPFIPVGGYDIELVEG